MASLQDYGIRFISHGAWSDPEIEWKKSKFQTVLFNYWDVAECTDYEKLCESTEDADLRELVSQLWGLTPSFYKRPQIDYEWEVDGYDDCDYFKGARLSTRKDFVLHTAGQALRQAFEYIESEDLRNAEIRIFRNEHGNCHLVANYRLQGSTLKDLLH